MVRAEGVTLFVVAPPALVTVMVTVICWPPFLLCGVVMAADSAAELCIVMGIEVALAAVTVTGGGTPSFVPAALPVNATVPADTALYVQVNVASCPAGMTADAGAGPLVRVAEPEPLRVSVDGMTLEAVADPPL